MERQRTLTVKHDLTPTMNSAQHLRYAHFALRNKLRLKHLPRPPMAGAPNLPRRVWVQEDEEVREAVSARPFRDSYSLVFRDAVKAATVISVDHSDIPLDKVSYN